MARQSEIPGTESPRIKALDAAAEVYFKQAKAYGRAGEKVKQALSVLAEEAKKHLGDETKTYVDRTHVPALVVTLNRKEKISVRALDGEDDDTEAEDIEETEAKPVKRAKKPAAAEASVP